MHSIWYLIFRFVSHFPLHSARVKESYNGLRQIAMFF